MAIITIISACLAVCSVLVPVLFFTGVLSVATDKQITAQKASHDDVYEYLLENGTFSYENVSAENAEKRFAIEWVDDGGLYKLQRLETADSSYPLLYSFTDNVTRRIYAWVCDSSLNCFVINTIGRADFFAWCEEADFDTKQIMDALDRYAESRK